MEKYDYLEAVKEDVLEYIKEKIDLEEWAENIDGLEEKLNDELWISDRVTGNASGSYTFNSWKAEEYLCHNLDLLEEAAEAFDCHIDILAKGAEYCDVTIRCYLLGLAISEVLEELEEE